MARTTKTVKLAHSRDETVRIKPARYFKDFPALGRSTKLTNVIFLFHVEKWVSDCETES